jgi:hypothetical protein
MVLADGDSDQAQPVPVKASEFERELRQLLNRHSSENHSDTPDFILAAYITDCLNAWATAVKARDSWFSFDPWPHRNAVLPAPTRGT